MHAGPGRAALPFTPACGKARHNDGGSCGAAKAARRIKRALTYPCSVPGVSTHHLQHNLAARMPPFDQFVPLASFFKPENL
jgi:hypothetical protein